MTLEVIMVMIKKRSARMREESGIMMLRKKKALTWKGILLLRMMRMSMSQIYTIITTERERIQLYMI